METRRRCTKRTIFAFHAPIHSRASATLGATACIRDQISISHDPGVTDLGGYIVRCFQCALHDDLCSASCPTCTQTEGRAERDTERVLVFAASILKGVVVKERLRSVFASRRA